MFMKTLDAIIKSVRNVAIPLTFLAMPLVAQNQVTGHVEKVPSETNAFARTTLTNTSNSDKYAALTDSTTGNFSLNVPTGIYQRKVEVQNCFLYIDTLDINAPQTMSLQMIEDIGKTSTEYSSILEILKVLTATEDPPLSKNTIMERWHDTDRPIKFFARNYDPADPYSMPQDYRIFLDSAKNDINNKSATIVQFNEQSVAVDVGINFEYRHNNEMPAPGVLGYTLIEESYSDNSPKKVTIYINRDNLTNNAKNQTFRREFMRPMITTNSALDNTYIMGNQSQATVLHPDEGKVLQIMYTLANLTDMLPYKNVVVNYPVPVELTEFNALTKDNIVKLLWKTATEINNHGFQIERKGKVWDSIGFVDGHGTSNIPHDYNFADTIQTPGTYSYRLKQVDNDGKFKYGAEVKVDLTKIIQDYSLLQNYPNPFNPETNIQFKIPQPSHVTLKVYDILGKEVTTLADETINPGTYTKIFNGKNNATGVYFYKLDAVPTILKSNSAPYSKTDKMILIK